MASRASRFDIYWVNLDPTIGREIKKTRPCVVISPDEINRVMDTIIVAPLTSTILDLPFRMTTKSPKQLSSIACDQIRTISVKRLGKKVARLSQNEQKQLTAILYNLFAL